MATKPSSNGHGALSQDQIQYLKDQMRLLAERNPSWGINPLNDKELFPYLAIKKITYLYDDELFEGLVHVDQLKTGKPEELLDAYLILDQGSEIHLKLFQFKFKQDYGGGISTKELYAFVDRMNRVFLHGDLQDEQTMESFRLVRQALDAAQKSNKRASIRVHCYYIVNGQNVSESDSEKVQEIRDTFSHDRQAYGFKFETYGGTDIYSLLVHGRIPIQEEFLYLEHYHKEGSLLHHNIGTNPNGMPIQVLVGFVNVNQLIRLVDRYSNNELFEKNVRLFLGTSKEVNRKIIETITSNRSAWFGFMNNGVSITAEDVLAEPPPNNNQLRVRLRGMQVINGCQTVNALYHAKYSPELKDRFQGNSNVLVRIYQIDPQNKDFLNSLIIATNSQNAIRPEDLVSNDNIQRTMQQIYRDYGIGYERKEGEATAGTGLALTFTKEQAAMAYLAMFRDGYCSKLRNSLSRREFFREGEEYYRAFDLAGGEPENEFGQLPDDFVPGPNAHKRALQMLGARFAELRCRSLIKTASTKAELGSLKKGAFYLARMSYLLGQAEIDQAIGMLSVLPPTKKEANSLRTTVDAIVGQHFEKAQALFLAELKGYLETKGTNEDAALKNQEFAKRTDAATRSALSK